MFDLSEEPIDTVVLKGLRVLRVPYAPRNPRSWGLDERESVWEPKSSEKLSRTTVSGMSTRRSHSFPTYGHFE